MTLAPAYSPMDCEQYSQLELAILHGRTLRLRWVGRGMSHIEYVRPEDLRTRRHAEYLLLRDAMTRRRFLRLDRIVQFVAIG